MVCTSCLLLAKRSVAEERKRQSNEVPAGEVKSQIIEKLKDELNQGAGVEIYAISRRQKSFGRLETSHKIRCHYVPGRLQAGSMRCRSHLADRQRALIQGKSCPRFDACWIEP